MDGNARFVIKLKGFDGDKEDLKEIYEEEVLPEIISPNTTEIPTVEPTAEPTEEPTELPDVTDPNTEG